MTAPLRQQMAQGWAAIGGQSKGNSMVHDHQKPTCPLCSAPAAAGYAWANWSDLGHDCNCVMDQYDRYTAGLRRLWAKRQALPTFLASLPEMYRAYTLNSLTRTEANREALAGLEHWTRGNIYLFGQAGTGKTHLGVAFARELATLGATTKFWGVASLFKALRESYQYGTPRPELGHWDVLLLDDIDKIKPTAFVYETYYELVESRWANGKTTIYTSQSNPDGAALMLTPEGNERAADPLASRMASGLIFEFTGADQRFGGNA